MAGFTGWCWVDDNGVFRRARTEEIRRAIDSGSVTVDVFVWREGMAAFLPARVFAAFSDLATGDLSQALHPDGSADLPGEVIDPSPEQIAAHRRTKAVTASSTPAKAPAGTARAASRVVRPAASAAHSTDDMPTVPNAPFPDEQIPEDMPTIPRAGLPLTRHAVDELVEPTDQARSVVTKEGTALASAASAEAPEEATATFVPPSQDAAEKQQDDARPVRDPSSPQGFRGVSAEFFKEGESIEQRWPDGTTASQPDLESSARISLPGPDIEVQPLSVWQEIGLRVRHEKWFWWMVAGLSAIVLLGMSGLLVRLFRGGPEGMPESQATALDGSTGTPMPGVSQSASGHPSPAVAPPAIAACVVAHGPERVAPTAWKDVLPEAWVAQDGSRFAVGFASGVLKASGVVMDLPGLKVGKAITKPAFRSIRRVVPLAQGNEPSFAVDDDDPTLRMKKAVTVPSTRPARVGWTKDALVVAERGAKATSLIWARPAGEPGDAVRAFGLGSSGLAIAFRQGDILWLGFADETFKPKGSLQRVQGTGAKVSTPSVGWNGQEAAMAFADESNGTWQIRVATARPGEPPGASEPWPTPAGGPGGVVSSPSIAAVDEGRWLIVWTEGEGSARVVRAQTCDAQLRAAGAPLEISQQAASAGQGVVALARGKGAIAYLTAAGAIHQVWATSIHCP